LAAANSTPVPTRPKARNNGKVIFKCNDPAVSEVYVEYAYETIEDVWRMVAYIVE
jgi:hypothetical protein